MAKYHWRRITNDPDLYRDLMITMNVQHLDADALWPQLPDVCSEGTLPFMHLSCVISLLRVRFRVLLYPWVTSVGLVNQPYSQVWPSYPTHHPFVHSMLI